MTDSVDQLVARFRACLEATEGEDDGNEYGSASGLHLRPDTSPGRAPESGYHVNHATSTASMHAPECTDLFSLYSELAGLKNEIRLESRQLKSALEQFTGLFDTLKASNDRQARELDARRAADAETMAQANRPLLLEILELKDRIESGLTTARSYEPKGLARLSSQPSAYIGTLSEGMQISLRRVDDLLARHDIERVCTMQQALDPHTMQACGVERRADLPDGQVISELRAGYTCAGTVLRYADVIVNRKEST